MKFAKGDSAFAKAFAKTQFVGHLEQGIAGPDIEWSYEYSPKVGDDGWHPSGHCTPSIHELWSIATGKTDEKITGMNKIFQVGHFWHQYLQYVTLNVMDMCNPSAIERTGTKVWGGTKKNPKPFHYATGSGDIAPVNLPNGKDVLIDFKTMSSYAYRNEEVGS